MTELTDLNHDSDEMSRISCYDPNLQLRRPKLYISTDRF